MGFLLYFIISTIILWSIIYFAAKNAFNDSKAVQLLEEIRDMLKQQTEPEKETQGEACPACGSKVMSTDQYCSSCGITLIVNEEKPDQNK